MALLPLGKRTGFLALAGLLVTALAAAAQESPTPPPSVSPVAKTVRIHFLPPPLEGTISLGIFDATGKLVRVLHREAEMDEFEIGSDALSTTWDGRGDDGEAQPPGKYRAHGYVVGDVDVEGVDFFFNDWVTEQQSLHVGKITAVAVENGAPLLTAQLSSGETVGLVYDDAGNFVTTGEIHEGHSDCRAQELPALIERVACAPGKDGTQWIIDRVAPGSAETAVAQISKSKEFLRRLSVPAQDPQPRGIAALPKAETILLLEENSATQRVRSLTLLTTTSDQGQSISDWKVDFEKAITAHKDFTIEDGQPVLSGVTPPMEKISVTLMANPLQKKETDRLELAVGLDAEGSFLKTADGLPLQSISETPHLTRVVLAPRSETSVDVFQDDDAVVEQFRLSALDRIMAFDCGEIELK